MISERQLRRDSVVHFLMHRSEAGGLVERVRYSAYGIPTAFPAGDTDFDGDWDATDAADIGSNYTPGSTYAVRRDADLDGDVDAADVTHANSITGGYQTLGRDVLTSAAVRNRIGYAGYQYDPTFAGVDRHLYHVRHRVYDAELGRWTTRVTTTDAAGSAVTAARALSQYAAQPADPLQEDPGGSNCHFPPPQAPELCAEWARHKARCLCPTDTSFCALCRAHMQYSLELRCVTAIKALGSCPPFDPNNADDKVRAGCEGTDLFPYGPQGPERTRPWKRRFP